MLRSGERGGHEMPPFLDIKYPAYISRMTFIETLAVMSRGFILLKPDMGNIAFIFLQVRNKKVMKHSQISLWIHCHRLSTLILKKCDPIIPTFDKAHHTVTFWLIRRFWCNSLWFSFVQYRQFCLLTWPSRWKWASSEVMITARSSWRRVIMCLLNRRRWERSCWRIFCTIIIL